MFFTLNEAIKYTLHFLRERKITVELSSRKWTPSVHKKAKVLVTGAAWLLTRKVLDISS